MGLKSGGKPDLGQNEETTMTFEQFVELIRQEIRDVGFMPNVKLAARIVIRANEEGVPDINYGEVLSSLVCDDIHTVKYTNSHVAEYRVKDLYYYNPNKK